MTQAAFRAVSSRLAVFRRLALTGPPTAIRNKRIASRVVLPSETRRSTDPIEGAMPLRARCSVNRIDVNCDPA